MSGAFTRGNALADARDGWFVGQFVDSAGGLRRRGDVELKWGVHPRGERRADSWVSYRTATTIAILIEGEILIRVRAAGEATDVHLKARGDYVIVPPGVDHTWQALTDCVVLTVRTPSIAGDAIRPC